VSTTALDGWTMTTGKDPDREMDPAGQPSCRAKFGLGRTRPAQVEVSIDPAAAAR